MASTAGESRRRKNVDRGSDRLALITCQIHALPPGYPSQPLNSQDPPLHLSNKITESSLAKPSRSTSGTEQNLKQQRWISSSVTPNQITSAIAASEKSRLRCSVVVALSAVLSHLGFPLLGSNLISSIINFRPLYLVLLTNVTLVLFNNQRAFKGAVEAENKIPSTGGTDWTEQASEALKVAW
ncbi:hypothetical protein POPTR_006G244600v4 [Populus trichocarpa]|uniref:Amino acid transporter transmembrane domain-containing protein n=1 Tax=Populus trichocarpa TaxID=3694 RepID=B9HE17_POPTR|nr:hypothetical protein POPTR_006G244600v4 [Populus trichocarpa]